MPLIIALDIVVTIWLVGVAFSKGFEEALPHAAFLLLLFPSESQLSLPGLFDLTTQRVIVLVLIALWIGTPRASLRRSGTLPLTYLILLTTGWMLLSSANSVVPSISFKSTLSQLFDFFVVYFIYAKSISRVETINRILFAFVSCMFVCSVLGIIEAYSGWSVMSLFPALPSRFSEFGSGVNDRGVRIQSTFGHAILFGSTLAMSIPVALHLLEKTQSPSRRAFLWIATLMMLVCIYKTGSRGPWIALALALGALFLFCGTAMRKFLASLAVLALVALIARPGIGGSLSSIYSATRDPTSPEGQSYQWRYMLYNLTERELAKSTERALWGYGPESFYSLHLTAPFMVDGDVRTVKVQSCDSAVVEIAMDTGYVGLMLIVLIFGKAALVALQQSLSGAITERKLPLILLIALGAFSFMMTNVEIYVWGQQNYMLWIIVACIIVCPMLSAQRRGDVTVPSQRSELQAHLAFCAGKVQILTFD